VIEPRVYPRAIVLAPSTLITGERHISLPGSLTILSFSSLFLNTMEKFAMFLPGLKPMQSWHNRAFSCMTVLGIKDVPQ
jgi:hypothetical protein